MAQLKLKVCEITEKILFLNCWTFIEIDIEPGNLIKVLDDWGPAYQVDFDVWIDKFDGEVMHLTTGEHCCRIGTQVQRTS